MEFSINSLAADGFTWQTALSLATASKLSYEGDSVVTNIVRNSWGFDRCEFIDVNETQGFVASNDDVVLVAFRGTESLGDWLGNLRLRSTSRPNYGEVHSGFLGAYLVAQGEVMSALARAGASTKRVVVTGHSLGGALSAVFAGEEFSRVKVHGIYTFGQPRSGADGFQAFFSATYPNRYFRFVNDDDIVPRIPPGYVHVGQLIHFDRFGNLQQADSEAEAVQMESPPLTEAEFFDLQRQIKEVQLGVTVAGAPPGAAEAAVDASVEGLFPSVSDHKMDRYIAAIRRFTTNTAEGDAGRVVMTARLEMHGRNFSEGGLESIQNFEAPPSQKVPVLLRLNDSAWNAPADLKINSRFGTIISALCTPEQLQRLENDAGVAGIEHSRDAGNYELAVSLPFVKGDVAHRPPLSETGAEALIGLIDSGIDVLHEAFRDATGKTRIAGIWNQRVNTPGKSPRAVDAKFSQDYGTVYTRAEIDSFIAAASVPHSALRDPRAHGTHVAGIAAGRLVGTAEGVAPDAQIIVVIPNMKTSPGDPPSLGYSLSHVDALSFLKTAAVGGNAIVADARPMAVNVSLGMNAGAHDGTSTLEAAFDAITGGGRDPDFVIVKSAGNERGFGGHARERAVVGAVRTVAWESTTISRFQDYLEVWYSSKDALRFQLIDPAGNKSAVVSDAVPVLQTTLGGNLCQLKLTLFHPDNGANQLTLTILPQTDTLQSGIWRLEIVADSIASREGHVDIWMERDDTRPARFSKESEFITLSIPGTALTVITVSACEATDPLRDVPSSSMGRTWDDRSKPDICAPGHEIVAAHSNQTSSAALIRMTGTSMAAPHVTGSVALALSRRFRQRQTDPAKYKRHNARQMQAALVRSTKNFSHVHHEATGFGVIDIERFLATCDQIGLNP